MYTILVCDDEQDIVSALEIYLTAEGYRVLKAYNGKEALAVAAREEVHLILMDIMMPVMDGLTAMAQLRQTSNVPVILLTAKSEDTDKVLGLNVGADDYITKPFNPVEMLARVRSQLRRYLQLGGGTVQPSTLVIGGIRLDDNAKAVTVDGENAALNPVNIIESRKFQVTTPEVKITVPPEYSYMVEARIIDGRRFILIPADDGVEVNGIAVTIPNPQE